MFRKMFGMSGRRRSLNLILLLILALTGLIGFGCSSSDDSSGGGTTGGTTTQVPDPVADGGPDLSGVTVKSISSPQTEEIVFINGGSSVGSEWAWSLVSKPDASNYQFTSANTQTTGFYADTSGDYTLQLDVSNGEGKTATDTVKITLFDDMDLDGLTDTNDQDVDGDGFLNTDDEFSTDKASHYDFDSDGTGNYYESDVDGDGTNDINDDYPLTAGQTQFSTYSESTENGSSNQNDGISVSETAGSVPIRVTGAIEAENNRVDIDYFKVSFGSTGRYSVVLVGADQQMSPAVAIINSNGTSVSMTSANMPVLDGSTAISIYIDTAGDYYLSVTDSQGASASNWTYTVRIFTDEDLDGVSDDLEKAIDSNHLTSDSDGDSISDYIEITDAVNNWSQYKDTDNDNLPCWWDLDSDGDTVPDAVEYFTSEEFSNLSAIALSKLNDADDDGVDNYLDTDSDGNGLPDSSEVGENPNNPLDTDGDLTPDFADTDDDNDGLLDKNESTTATNSRVTPLTPSDTSSNAQAGTVMALSSLYNSTLGAENVARSGDSVVIDGYNLPSDTSKTWIIIRGQDGVVNSNPGSIASDGLHFTWPDEFSSGLVEVFIAYNDMYSDSLAVMIPASDAPILTGYSISSGTITFTGANLDDTLAVYFNGASGTSYNSSGSSTSADLSIPYNAKGGDVYASGSEGQSNTIWVDLSRTLSGTVVKPSGSTVDVTELDVSWSADPDDEINPSSNGSFTTNAALNGPTIVTALVNNGDTSSPAYAVFLESLALATDSSVTLDSDSTALALVWDGCGVQGLVAESSLSQARYLLEALSEVASLASTLETKLASDPFILSKNDSEIKSKAQSAATAAATAIQNAIADGTLTVSATTSGLASLLRGLEDAAVTPTEVDDIKILTDSSGNVSVENDSQLYLSAKITGSDGKVLQQHISGIRGMAGPQGYGLLFWASTSSYKQPQGKNCVVQIITPGADKEYDPKSDADYNVYKYLLMRTVVERVLWPPISSVISLKFNPSELASILMNNAPGIPGIIDDFAQGNVKNGLTGLLNALWQDIANVPPGPITEALAKKYGKGLAEQALKKLAAKIGAKFVPGVGQIALAYEIAGYVNSGVNAAKAVDDLLRTDSVIEYNVKFPVQIDSVAPSKIKPDGKDKKFLITGIGFSDIIEGLVFKNTLKPRITFTDNEGYEVTREPDFTNASGTKMTVTIPGWFLDEYTEGPIDVTVHHPKNEPNAKVTKDDAVTIVDKTEISSISPDEGSAGTAATVYGAGFSNIVSDNEVMVGSSTALISRASDTALSIVIPTGLAAGDYDVKARSRFDGSWSDWSNTVTYKVVEGEIKITVSDDGGAKDDAFALYVDGVYIGTMYASNSDYTDVYTLSLAAAGTHTALLVGVEAPDSVGTYYISFSGVSNVTGDSTSGDDLVPGVRKYYTFTVSATRTLLTKKPIQAFPYKPRVIDAETARMRTP